MRSLSYLKFMSLCLLYNMILSGRYDIRLPDFVVDQLKLQTYLEPILSKLRSVMGTPRPVIRTQNLVFVPVGSPPQEWHCDDTIKAPKNARYFTILIHLNPIDSMSGGTEIWMKTAKKGDLVSSFFKSLINFLYNIINLFVRFRLLRSAGVREMRSCSMARYFTEGKLTPDTPIVCFTMLVLLVLLIPIPVKFSKYF